MILAALQFTLLEAFLSAGLSVILGAVLAWLWMRVRWNFRDTLEPLVLLPFFFPALFVVLAVLRFFGNQGLGFDVYGLWGIVLAHILLNLPLVFYLIMSAWRGAAPETIMLASHLGVVHQEVERRIWRRVLPMAFALVFLYASLSFTIVLVLGGGPNATTLELLIYDAMRNRFDVPLALRVSVLQSLIGLGVFWALRRPDLADRAGDARLPSLDWGQSRSVRIWQSFGLVLMLALLLLPFILLMSSGLAQIMTMIKAASGAILGEAMLRSLGLAVIFAVFVNTYAVFLVRQKWDGLAWIFAAISPLVLAVIFLSVARLWINPFHLGVPFVVFVQILVLSPLFVRIWRQALDEVSPEERQLLASLRLGGWGRVRLFYAPRFGGVWARGMGIAMAMSVGDLALYPLMAPHGFVTLPILIWQMMGSYRFDAAMALGAVMILGIALILMLWQWFARIWERRYA